MFQVNHAEATQALQLALKANVVPFLQGSPANGKSAIIKELAKFNNLELIDLRLSQLQPYDLAGLVHPEGDKFTYLPLDEFPLEKTKLPKGKDGWLLFLDEFNSADRYTAAACYKLILDRAVGKHKLHPNVRIVCAGNKQTDGAITHNLGTAIQSRVIHYELVLNAQQWLDWLIGQFDWNPLIYFFLDFRKELINNFDPSTEVITYASPRTWELLSKQLNEGLLDYPEELQSAIVCGTVGEKAGTEFLSFVEVYNDLPKIEDIIANPEKTKLPKSIGGRWALGAYVSNYINAENTGHIIKYLARIEEVDIKTAIFRSLMKHRPTISSNMIFMLAASELIHNDFKEFH